MRENEIDGTVPAQKKYLPYPEVKIPFIKSCWGLYTAQSNKITKMYELPTIT